jgi:hypothetical protein
VFSPATVFPIVDPHSPATYFPQHHPPRLDADTHRSEILHNWLLSVFQLNTMSETPSGSGSLEDRISKPEKSSWADEVASPATEDPPTISSANGKQPESAPQGDAQVDGATEPFGGSELQEPEFEVEIKLADMQADPNNPLYSAASFEQLGL